jgi:ATP-binding cassette subfamily B protein
VLFRSIIVAQRISSIKSADQIIVLDKGQVVGSGTHEKLLQTNSVYQEIVASQASKGAN